MPPDQPTVNELDKNEGIHGRVRIVTNSFESAYYSRMIQAASTYLTPRGFQLSVRPKVLTNHGEREAFASLADNDCDGLIIHADRLSDEELSSLMIDHPCAVLLDRFLPSAAERCVFVDNRRGGELAAEYLIAQGHKRIAMVSGPDSFFEVQGRSVGFKDILYSNGIELLAEACGDFVHAGGEKAMEQIHSEAPDVTAVFFQNDVMAFGGLNACRRLNINVPEDVSIVGLDGIPMCQYVSPKLTTVQKPLRQLGEHAAQMISDLILGVDYQHRTLGTGYTPRLAERESVAPPKDHQVGLVTLTQREAECLTWTANGKTSWEISVILGISESTATFHLRNAGIKLKASNRAHAVAKALHLGLIDFMEDALM